MATLGFVLIVLGYVLAIVGGWLLFANGPRDLPTGTIPRTNDIAKHVADERNAIAQRAANSRRGFLLLTFGAIAQLTGVVLQWIWPLVP